jgi:transketolase
MRTAFIETLTQAAKQDPRIMLLVGDLGFGVVNDFAERFPKQFVNVGVAEQNMAGIATGLALSGKIVFTYSIANFPILRCLEQLRNDVCYHRANVVSVSVGCGFSYGALGMTHHGTEDIGIMRTLPYMTTIAPGDPIETQAATAEAAKGIGPVFLRLGRDGEPVVHNHAMSWELGKAITVNEGTDITLISTGAMLKTTVNAAEVLSAKGIKARVLSMHTLKPIDREAILTAAHETAGILTIEEHSRIGGLGGAVAEIIAEEVAEKVCFKRIALPSEFSEHVGNQDYLRGIYGLTIDGIVENTIALLRNERRKDLYSPHRPYLDSNRSFIDYRLDM